jgi:diguanylate cyclase (GGDEF)-like protein
MRILAPAHAQRLRTVRRRAAARLGTARVEAARTVGRTPVPAAHPPGASAPRASGPARLGAARLEEAPAVGRAPVRAARPAPASASPEAGTDPLVERLVARIPMWLLLLLVFTAGAAAAAAFAFLRERARTRQARREALSDPLTGVANRLAFDRRLADEWERARRVGQGFGVLVVDLDDFKAINDSGGHAAGDRLLRAVAGALSSCTRQNDMVARFGGDEFAIIAVQTDADDLSALAERLREGIDGIGASASVGWSEIVTGDGSPEEVLARADRAMYLDKRDTPPAVAV